MTNIKYEERYRGRNIQVAVKGALEEVSLDGEAIPHERDADTGAYRCSSLPYRTFGTLDELAKALVDERGD
ncbi:MAG: hypothetical protein KC636_33130 [Myxococcales bacterium]|nr:hypothetical protein [Myxococcales bacterium]